MQNLADIPGRDFDKSNLILTCNKNSAKFPRLN